MVSEHDVTTILIGSLFAFSMGKCKIINERNYKVRLFKWLFSLIGWIKEINTMELETNFWTVESKFKLVKPHATISASLFKTSS